LTQSWNLTKVGDWTSVTTNGTAQNRTHGPTHELLTAGGQNISTDVKGNITLLPSNLTPQSSPLALQWDFDNKLKGADLGNNSSVDVNFQYDALGRRVARTGTGGSVVYVQHDQQTIADYPVGGVASTPTNRYVYASYIDEPVVRKAAGTSGTIHYYHRNQQYSITAMTSSTGAVAERYAYTAYGQPTILNASGTVLTSSAVGNRYTYTGREWDETLGLHHFRARWMSPLAGRFLGRDPGLLGARYTFESALGLDGAGYQFNLVSKIKNTLCDRCGESQFVVTHSPDNNSVAPKGDVIIGYLVQEIHFAAAIAACEWEECGPCRPKSFKVCSFSAYEMIGVVHAKSGMIQVDPFNARDHWDSQGQLGLVDCNGKGVRAFISNVRLLAPNNELEDWYNLRVGGGMDIARDSCGNPIKMNPGSKDVLDNPPPPGWDKPLTQNIIGATVIWNCCPAPKDGPATTCSPSGTTTNDFNKPIRGN
jgi:RHS repeat-associated protein